MFKTLKNEVKVAISFYTIKYYVLKYTAVQAVSLSLNTVKN